MIGSAAHSLLQQNGSHVQDLLTASLLTAPLIHVVCDVSVRISLDSFF